nr:hypothetical protein CFP56_65671 [Quercus suber]
MDVFYRGVETETLTDIAAVEMEYSYEELAKALKNFGKREKSKTSTIPLTEEGRYALKNYLLLNLYFSSCTADLLMTTKYFLNFKMEDMRMQFVDLLSSIEFVDFQFSYFQVF